MSVKVVHTGSGEIKVTAETTPAIKVTSPDVDVVNINPVYRSAEPGPTGAQGPTGATGAGVEEGGSENQFLQKNSATDYDTKWSAYTMPGADGLNGQILVTDGAGALTFDHVRSTHIEIRNDEGATIPAGTPVYSKGEIGGSERILVGIADASDPAKMPAIGIAETTLTTTGDTKDGYAIMSGVFNTNVSGFTELSEGDILYVSNSGGGLSQTKPTGTYLIQNVGIVLKTNGTVMQGFQVACIGRTNDVPNITEDYFWIGNSSGVATPTDFDTRVASAPAVVANTAKSDGTDLSVSTTSDNVTVISDTGTNATITEATASQAGVMTVDMHDKLDGIDANADETNSTNVDAAGAIMHSDIAADGFIRRTGTETYDQITPGTGLSVSGSNLIVSANTTLAAVDDTDNVILKVTGPSGTQDAGVTLTPSDRLTIEPVGNTVTFTVDNDLANYSNTTSQFIKYANLSSTGTVVSGISLTYNNSTGAFDLSGSVSVTEDDISDLGDYLLNVSEDLTPSLGGTLDASGQNIEDVANINVGSQIRHQGDTDTYIEFPGTLDKVRVVTGNSEKLFISNDLVEINSVRGDVDFKVNGDNATNVLFVNAGSDRVGIKTETPQSELHVVGDITVSGTVDGKDVSTLLAHSDFTGGTGISYTSGTIDVDVHTTIETDQVNDDATITVTGPSGVSDAITLAAGSNVTLTESGDQITIASANDNTQLSDAQVQTIVGGMFIGNTETRINATYDSSNGKIDLVVDTNLANYSNTNSGFLTGLSSTDDLSDVNGGGTADGQVLIYNNSNSEYVPGLINGGSNVTVTNSAGGISIAATNTEYTGGTGITISPTNVISADAAVVDELNDLSDVSVNNESANQYLVHNGSGAFVNQALDISHDETPVLGGHLDVQNKEIRSTTTDGNIIIQPNGSGNVKLGNFEFDVDQSIGPGVDDFVLTYDDVSRTISLEAASGGVDTSGTPADDQIAVFTDADTVEGSSGLTYDGSTFVTDAVAQVNSVKIGNQGSSVLNAAGKFDFGARVVYDLGTGTSLIRGDVYSYKGSWTQSDADAESTSKGLLGVAVGTAASSGFVLQGVVRMHDNTGFPSGTTSGEVLYLDTDAGHVTITKPTGTGDIVRVVGYVIDAANKIIYFDPSKDWIELA